MYVDTAFLQHYKKAVKEAVRWYQIRSSTSTQTLHSHCDVLRRVYGMCIYSAYQRAWVSSRNFRPCKIVTVIAKRLPND